MRHTPKTIRAKWTAVPMLYGIETLVHDLGVEHGEIVMVELPDGARCAAEVIESDQLTYFSDLSSHS